MTRRVAVVLAAALLVVAGVAAFLLLRGDDKPAPPKAPVAIEPLAFMPADADVVFDLDTAVPAIAVAAAELVPKLPGATVTAEQIRPLVGGRMAVALKDRKLWLAAATSAPAPPGATKRGGTVIVAPGSVTQTLGARAAFDKRLAGLPRSSARVAFAPRVLAPQIANTTWGKALTDGAAALTIEGARIALPFRLRSAPVKPEDLPIATGTQAPSTHGSAPVVAATRSPAQSLRFLRDAGLLPALDVLERAPGFLKPDLDNLGPDATITTADAKLFTVRLTPPDPGRLGDQARPPRRALRPDPLRRPRERADRQAGRRLHDPAGRRARRPRRRLRPRRRALERPAARTSRRRRARPRSRRPPTRAARSRWT